MCSLTQMINDAENQQCFMVVFLYCFSLKKKGENLSYEKLLGIIIKTKSWKNLSKNTVQCGEMK